VESGRSVEQPNRSENETKDPCGAHGACWERPRQRTVMCFGGSHRVAAYLLRRQEEKGAAQAEEQSDSRLHGARLTVSHMSAMGGKRTLSLRCPDRSNEQASDQCCAGADHPIRDAYDCRRTPGSWAIASEIEDHHAQQADAGREPPSKHADHAAHLPDCKRKMPAMDKGCRSPCGRNGLKADVSAARQSLRRWPPRTALKQRSRLSPKSSRQAPTGPPR